MELQEACWGQSNRGPRTAVGGQEKAVPEDVSFLEITADLGMSYILVVLSLCICVHHRLARPMLFRLKKVGVARNYLSVIAICRFFPD